MGWKVHFLKRLFGEPATADVEHVGVLAGKRLECKLGDCGQDDERDVEVKTPEVVVLADWILEHEDVPVFDDGDGPDQESVLGHQDVLGHDLQVTKVIIAEGANQSEDEVNWHGSTY